MHVGETIPFYPDPDRDLVSAERVAAFGVAGGVRSGP